MKTGPIWSLVLAALLTPPLLRTAAQVTVPDLPGTAGHEQVRKASGQQARSSPLIVAYMTPDGALIPVARFDGSAWRNTWPEPIPDSAPLPVRSVGDVPREWLGQPVPLTWHAWSLATQQTRPATVTGLDRDGACVQAITLATSFKPDPRSEGLATSRPAAVDAIVQIEQDSPDWERLRRDMAPHFRAAVARPAPFSPKEEPGAMGARALALARADTLDTLTVEAAYRDPRHPLYFIEVERRFAAIPVDTDYDSLSYGGWFRRDASGALIPISASVVAASSGEGKLPRYTPVGLLRVGARSIWVLSEWGKESQAIVLFDVSAGRIRRLTSADISGC